MDQPNILRLALPTPLRRLFDYKAPQSIDYTKLVPGVRVKVTFQARELIGILFEVCDTSQVPAAKLREASAILDEKPIFTDEIYKLCQWACDYYHYALGEVLASALPVYLRKGKMVEKKDLAPTKVSN